MMLLALRNWVVECLSCFLLIGRIGTVWLIPCLAVALALRILTFTRRLLRCLLLVTIRVLVGMMTWLLTGVCMIITNLSIMPIGVSSRLWWGCVMSLSSRIMLCCLRCGILAC